jgi:hypothetical protein
MSERLKPHEKPKVGRRYRVVESFHEGKEGECISFEESAFGVISVTLMVDHGEHGVEGITKRNTDLVPV